MIPIKEAIEKAVTFAVGVLEPSRTGAILLEEVQTASLDGDDVWLITLSMPDPDRPLSPMFGGRQYKTFTVNGRTGEVISMKIRQLSGAT
jgi:hypothetical protein